MRSVFCAAGVIFMQQFLAAVCAETYPHSETSVLKMGDFEMLKKDALEEKRIFKILRIFLGG